MHHLMWLNGSFHLILNDPFLWCILEVRKRKCDVLDGMGSCTPNSSSGDAGYTSHTLFSPKFSIRIGGWNIRYFGNPTRQNSRLQADKTHDRTYGMSIKEHC